MEATTRNGKLKMQRKEKSQLILKDDLAGLEFINEDIILDNLRRHYNNRQIYIYIGEILLAINPYQELGIYSSKYGKKISREKSMKISLSSLLPSFPPKNCDHLLISNETVICKRYWVSHKKLPSSITAQISNV